MLVLSRRLGEKIFIGDNICITVVDIDWGKVRLGIEAPRDVPIYRQELLPVPKPGDPHAPGPKTDPTTGSTHSRPPAGDALPGNPPGEERPVTVADYNPNQDRNR